MNHLVKLSQPNIFSGETTSTQTPVEPIPEYTAREELEDGKNWRSVTIGDKKYKIDMKVIEPYKKVLSHGGEGQLRSVYTYRLRHCHCQIYADGQNGFRT